MTPQQCLDRSCILQRCVGTVSDCGVLLVDSGVKVLTGRGAEMVNCRRVQEASGGAKWPRRKYSTTNHHGVS